MDNKLKNCMIKVSLGASLAFAPLIDCNGAKKETPVVNPEPVNPKLTPKYWQDRLESLLHSVEEYGDVEFTPETYTPYLEALNRFQELLKKAEQGYLTNNTVGEYELAASNLSAKIANLKVQQKEVNNDPYDTDFALIKALEEFFPKIQGRNLTEEEQAKYSDELKEVFVKAYARDSYSKNLPFSSEEIKAAMTPIPYRFPYSGATHFGNGIVLGTLGASPDITIHETGHYWGLGESLTELLRNKYLGNKMIDNQSGANFSNLCYSPFYDNLLSNKVGDRKFWETIYKGPYNEADARYGNMWDENMTVKVNNKEETLVSFYDMQIARELSYFARNRSVDAGWDEITRDFEKYAGIKNVETEFEKLGPVYENAFKNNDLESIETVKRFFSVVKHYNADKKILQPEYALSVNDIKNFLTNMTQYKNKQSTQQNATVRVNLAQEVGVCR